MEEYSAGLGRDPASLEQRIFTLERQLLEWELRRAKQLEELHVAPTKPRNGMIVLADGTDWDPGDGEGVYAYYGAAWVKLLDSVPTSLLGLNNTWTGDNDFSGGDVTLDDILGANPFILQGATLHATNKVTVSVVDPTGARTLTIPDASVDLTKVRAASETLDGVSERATDAECVTHTDTSRHVTPAGLAAAFAVTGTAPMFACRAWCSWNGTGTVAINGSGNITSITDNGTGDTTVTIATDIEDVDYCVVMGNQYTNSGGHQSFDNHGLTLYNGATKLVGSVRVNTQYGNATSGPDDLDNFVAIFR